MKIWSFQFLTGPILSARVAAKDKYEAADILITAIRPYFEFSFNIGFMKDTGCLCQYMGDLNVDHPCVIGAVARDELQPFMIARK